MAKTSKTSNKKSKNLKGHLEPKLHPAAHNIIKTLHEDGWKVVSIYHEALEEDEA